MDVTFTPGAGLDVQKQTVMACRVAPDPTGRQADGSMELKACGTMTVDLLALSDWLIAAGITQVAMERTGESWKPGDHIWAGDFTGCRVNAAHATPVPGRKTAKREARWLATLTRHGVGQERRRQVNRLLGVRARATITLASVATDMMGLSGRAILRALLEGRARPRHDGRGGPGADAEPEPPPGAGPERAGPRPSPPAAGAAVVPSRLPGRTARHPER